MKSNEFNRSMEISLQIDVENEKHVIALSEFLGVIGNLLGEKPKVDKTRKPIQKKETVVEKKETPTEEKTATKTGIKIEDVRILLSSKVKENRTAIKDKLTGLEAANVTSLDKKHYPAFVAFLEEL